MKQMEGVRVVGNIQDSDHVGMAHVAEGLYLLEDSLQVGELAETGLGDEFQRNRLARL
eukprot:CAMPEP_0180482696 /NCGR_PEP_ID=MMETSP1036_2-20121128/35036_1 /TAXON_ID=632150 /ORGANISM="Azadinium spinosum, Strain 3D9" /LENGTH=57 /DNA_ID=CAMNT_0022490473 /DNA_START=843 /DNA_END=1016 /DNA_ORIENTATION=+